MLCRIMGVMPLAMFVSLGLRICFLVKGHRYLEAKGFARKLVVGSSGRAECGCEVVIGSTI